MGILLLRAWVWVQTQVAVARRSERGQGLVEYALIIALIAVLVIGALLALGGKINDVFKNITSTLNSGTTA